MNGYIGVLAWIFKTLNFIDFFYCFLAPAVYNTSNKIQVGIKELVNSDLSNQVSKGIANVSKQIKESVESAAETLYPV